ncbi:MAG: YbaB/EbfC family nucleoid-associated protein [Solirubrobacterales bacterium]|nr:YbaB/EbfC family nucleoid-associated protein [Solirubrobacterales bacterium]
MTRGRPGPGGPGGMDMGALLKQAQQMQADMTKAQDELKDEVVDASAGGGMIKVKVSGDLVLQGIEIDPDAVDPEDVEMLQDMVLAAVNEGIRAAQARAESKMGGIAGGLGGLGLPGM